ncbi:Type V secretory pathway adhesin AidA [Geitlerinema sp. FC II]|nr:Type V secretory pathway adhesin AidA [Geitlerinema sp. FC II]
MTSESPTPENQPIPKDSAIVEVSDETREMVDRDMPDADEDVKQKAMELLEAIRRKAQAEVQAANDRTQETYLKAIDDAKKTIEQTEQFAKEQQESLDNAVKMAQNEVQTRWDGLTKEIEEFGSRLQEAAETAWKIITQPKESDVPSATAEEASDKES